MPNGMLFWRRFEMGKLIVSPLPKNDKAAHDLALREKNREHVFFVFDSIGTESEASIFEGIYSKTCHFFTETLPKMRRLLIDLAKENTHVHLYLGAEIGMLYAAYYCAIEGIPFSVSLVDPQYIGGKSVWMQQHPLLRNKLITTVLAHANEVFIVGKEHFEMFPKAFPRVQREYKLLELSGEESVLQNETALG